MLFADRRDAGRRLAVRLSELRLDRPVVLALVRGGVPVGAEVAQALGAPLDVFVVRKVGAPSSPEFGIGAVAEGGVAVANARGMQLAGVDEDVFELLADRQRGEVERRVALYRGGREPPDVRGRTVVVVDDGLATGVTARGAVAAVRAMGAHRVVVAVPVGAPDSIEMLEAEADEVVCLAAPPGFTAVGAWYDDFHQVTDDEVITLVQEARAATRGAVGIAGPSPHRSPTSSEVVVTAGGTRLPGTLATPGDARGVVVFAHGSGSSRYSTRNRSVAEALQQAGLATLLFDLLTVDEADDRTKVFDVPLLASRLEAAAHRLDDEPEGRLPLGYFGASTGAAAALVAAADEPERVGAVVSRGGRPDLAADRLEDVRAPTLLLVGSLDRVVIGLNEEALARLRCQKELRIVDGASHLFEEPGTLERVAVEARQWFAGHLAAAAGGQPVA